MLKIIMGFIVAVALSVPALAASYDLVIDRIDVNFSGRPGKAIAVNGAVPGPTLRWTEGEEVVVNVTNRLDVDSSIHWHGIQLPTSMDGVPHLSFAGIKPGQTFTYRFKLKQAGTYWFHSHSGGQEQAGVYGSIIIAPKGGDRVKADRDFVVLLSDWIDMTPDTVMAKLKKQSNYFNNRRRTLGDLSRDLAAAKTPEQRAAVWADRSDWGQMRMDPTDIADVSGYTFLLNGKNAESNWTALFKPGEKIRLRFINGSAMTFFDVQIPGLKMTVIQADGQDVKPVPVDEFRIAVAETYDVLVEPKQDRAFTVFAQSMDRRGYARGTLAPRPGMSAGIPPMRSMSLLTMADMGMMGDLAGMDHSKMATGATAPGVMDHSKMDHSKMDHGKMGGDSPAIDPAIAEGLVHAPPVGADPGIKVLGYGDLRRADTAYKLAKPGREITLRLTGNMERYFWSFDDKKYSEAEPIRLKHNETVRLVFVNETMMNHPMHLHGLWFDVENGAGDERPRKHVINVPPGRTVTVDVLASEVGRWAFHCHLMYHMMAGMFREVIVEPDGGIAAPLPAVTKGGDHADHR